MRVRLQGLLLGLALLLSASGGCWAAGGGAKAQALPPDIQILIGEWQRIDGGYLLRIDAVHAEGPVQAAYFNPRPIRIATAEVGMHQDLMRLFIRFDDANYENSTYTLYYYAAKDALAGFYYQAPMDRTFEVIFQRKQATPQ